MQYRPTAAQLIETIGDLLERELLPALPAALQHKARVAGNLCRILEREETLEPDARRREHDLLVELLGREGEPEQLTIEFCERLRAGADAEFERRAWEVLVAVARDDLAIAKPGHDSWEGV